VVEKDFYFSEDISKLVMKGLVRKDKHDLSVVLDLNEREIEILKLICKEFTAAEIADKLNLSVRTIEGYRQKLLEKSGAKNMAGLVVFAIKNNLYHL
jgi:DNA-binding NarL/FixJ family response regulator